MARQEQDAMGGQFDSSGIENDALGRDADTSSQLDASLQQEMNTQADIPLQQEPSQPHYTISEDEIGKKNENKIAALALGMSSPKELEASTISVPPAAIPTSGPAMNPQEQKSANRRLHVGQPPRSPLSVSHTASHKGDINSRSQSSTAQRWKQPEGSYGKFKETHETQTVVLKHDYSNSKADSSETTVDIPEIYPVHNLASRLDTCTLTANAAENIDEVVVDMNELTNRASSELIGAEETSLLYLDVLRKMQQRIQQLEEANEELSRIPETPSGVKVQIFHCLVDDRSEDTVYLSEPEWMTNGDDIQLRARFPIMDPGRYIEEKDISFVVYKCYRHDHQEAAIEEARKSSGSLPNPEPAYQEILLASDAMVEAVKAFFTLYPSSSQEFPKVNTYNRLQAPFIWWYHHRKSSKVGSLPSHQSELVSALISHIEEACAPLYDNIDEQLNRGLVSNFSMEYLFRPGQVIVSIDDDVPRGYVAMSRAFAKVDEPRRNQRSSESHQDHSSMHVFNWAIATRSIDFRGNFVRVEEEISVDFETEIENGEIEILSLRILPLEYTSQAIQDRLVRRSQTFWKCRRKQLVSYQGKDGIHYGERYMIDYETYLSLHISSSYATKLFGATTEPNLPKDDSEPHAPEIYLFPNLVPGFDLRRKKWVDVEVDRIRDVIWNEHAFRSLVADEDMKTIIRALVTNQIDAKRGTDVIDNKGNGLIMLLHGSPGTGKTFTAESVAEIAKKPLYSVTCGDIGTNPADVEKYLESVFHLGKIWDCVVLLDEAEVFLEQRTLQDLQRNALVSVFLRALEYYDGILILTTNRVGTFDEAFKSRIQLALRYEKLEAYQRKQIWKNFFERLKNIGEEASIDFDDISLHIDELTRHLMNGRQIRNTITTARQLAKFMGKKMVFSHLQRTIAITNKFDQYLADVREADVEEHGGRGLDGRYSDEYFARSDQIR
ncbi:TOB3 (member of AAA-ATPase family) [Colletotrichum asianum]